MTRLWWLLVLGLAAMFGAYVTVGDYWRAAGSAFGLVCWLVVRADLTEPTR